ncbi:hypothetical protein JXR01_00400 [Candidatus Kaiserbacteria bacterium]|nr:MAG: hypothetical protein JXR01_00400 [Candidatus Kaiserbacteria bacterium]
MKEGVPKKVLEAMERGDEKHLKNMRKKGGRTRARNRDEEKIWRKYVSGEQQRNEEERVLRESTNEDTHPID